jgi:hypothetical protein
VVPAMADPAIKVAIKIIAMINESFRYNIKLFLPPVCLMRHVLFEMAKALVEGDETPATQSPVVKGQKHLRDTSLIPGRPNHGPGCQKIWPIFWIAFPAVEAQHPYLPLTFAVR